MKPRILVCQQIFTAIALLVENIQNLFVEMNKSDLQNLYRILESKESILYLPISLISHTRLILEKKYNLDDRKLIQITQKLLELGNANFDIDRNFIIEQANKIKNNSLKVDFEDLTNLIISENLNIDYIIARFPNHLRYIIEENTNTFKNFNTKIISINTIKNEFNTPQLILPSSNKILVFTPKNRVIELPINSTPVDFAYTIHTNMGHRCLQAKVNNYKVPLNYKLKTRDVVEIIEKEEPENPKIEWLKFVKTDIAKEQITRWHRRKKVDYGWEIIRNSFGHNIKPYKRQLEYAAIKIPGCKKLSDLAYKLGSGDCKIKEIQMFMADYNQEEKCSSLHCKDEKQPPLIGVEGYDWNIAKCCQEIALPSEALVGIKATRKNFISIHHYSCDNLNKIIDDSKKIEVKWNCNYCLITFQIQMNDRKDVLRQFLNELADKSIFLDLRSLTTYPNKTFQASFVETVDSREKLEHILYHIEYIREETKRPEVKNIKIKNVIPGAMI